MVVSQQPCAEIKDGGSQLLPGGLEEPTAAEIICIINRSWTQPLADWWHSHHVRLQSTYSFPGCQPVLCAHSSAAVQIRSHTGSFTS